MYDISCKSRNDSIDFFNMNFHHTLEIIEDFRNSYVLDIINTKTKKRYKIINKQSLKDFIKVEGKNKEVE